MKTKIGKNEYQCAACEEVFTVDCSDEEVEKEAQELFGKPTKEWKGGVSVVCDDCFNLMYPKDNPEAVEYAKSKI